MKHRKHQGSLANYIIFKVQYSIIIRIAYAATTIFHYTHSKYGNHCFSYPIYNNKNLMI